MRPGDTNMQGLRELGGELGGMPLLSGSLSDLPREAGEVALRQASEDSSASEAAGRQSPADVEGVRTRSQLSPAPEARISGLSGSFSTCTTPGLDPVEHSSAWGEFQGFRESSAKSEQFSRSFELPERATAAQSPRPASHKQHGSQPPPQGGPWVTGTAAISPSEPMVSYEKIFRFAFQEVPVEQAAEGVPTLDHFLEAGSEGEPGLGPESRRLWAALHHADSTSTSRCPWHASRCRQNFLLVLGVDSAQVSDSGGDGRTAHDCASPLWPRTPRHLGTQRAGLWGPGGEALAVGVGTRQAHGEDGGAWGPGASAHPVWLAGVLAGQPRAPGQKEVPSGGTATQGEGEEPGERSQPGQLCLMGTPADSSLAPELSETMQAGESWRSAMRLARTFFHVRYHGDFQTWKTQRGWQAQ
ncbi:uncharacterized protein CLBA1 isoform X2 [Pteropus vampyrus]|uniref:Uncharacterized protein CLBA1 isoform X2 n=1 Tax=Pteropus vampyrus TaxID=132908 RepID=A0A6P3R6A0_PTEVA|nr:uncharacterized protein CLBA1 isoform X2 [Pteropus vampyrus]